MHVPIALGKWDFPFRAVHDGFEYRRAPIGTNPASESVLVLPRAEISGESNSSNKIL